MPIGAYGGDLAWLLAARHPDLVDVVYPGLGHDMSPALIADWRALLHATLADATARGEGWGRTQVRGR